MNWMHALPFNTDIEGGGRQYMHHSQNKKVSTRSKKIAVKLI